MQRRYNGTRIDLQQAVAILIQNQAAWLASQRENDRHFLEIDRHFLKIERDLDQIKAILQDLAHKVDWHEQLLKDLPEAVRRKIGFKER